MAHWFTQHPAAVRFITPGQRTHISNTQVAAIHWRGTSFRITHLSLEYEQSSVFQTSSATMIFPGNALHLLWSLKNRLSAEQSGYIDGVCSRSRSRSMHTADNNFQRANAIRAEMPRTCAPAQATAIIDFVLEVCVGLLKRPNGGVPEIQEFD